MRKMALALIVALCLVPLAASQTTTHSVTLTWTDTPNPTEITCVDTCWDVLRNATGDPNKYVRRMNPALDTPQSSLSSTTYCLALAGREYLTYQPNTGAVLK